MRFFEGHMKSFERIKEEYGVPKSDFFRFLQLRNFLLKNKEYEKITKPTEIDEFWIKVKSDHTLDKVLDFIKCFYVWTQTIQYT